MKPTFWLVLILSLMVAGGIYLLQIKKLNDHLDQYHKHSVRLTLQILGRNYHEAKILLVSFHDRWSDLKKSANWRFPFSDKNWQREQEKDLRNLDHALGKTSFDEATHYLDKVRFETIAWCDRHHIPDAFGPIWNFECTLRNVHEIATDDMLNLVDWKTFEWMVSDLHRLYKMMEDIPQDSGLDEQQEVHESMQRLSEALIAFTISVESADGLYFSQTAQELYQSYLDFLSVIG